MTLTWEQRALQSLARLTTTFPVTILVLCLILVGLAVTYTASSLDFVTGRNDLIDSDKPYIKLEDQYTQEFSSFDQFFVVVEPQDIEQGKAFVVRLGELLAQETTDIEEVFYQIDTTSLDGKKLLYLPKEDLQKLFDDLSGSHDLVREITTTPGLNSLFQAINHQVSAATVSYLVDNLLGLDLLEDEPQDGAGAEESQQASSETPTPQIGFLNSLLYEMDQALSNPAYRYHSRWCGRDVYGFLFGLCHWSE